MVLSSIEVMALVLAIVGIVKVIVIVVNPSAWRRVIRAVYGSRGVLTIVSLVFGAVTLYYLLKEITIVQIFAAMLFLMFVMLLAVSAYSKQLLAFYDTLLKDRAVVAKAWVAIIVWVILTVWVLYSIFA